MKPFFKAPKELKRGYKDRKHLAKVALLGCRACIIEKAPKRTRLEVNHKAGIGAGKKASDLLTFGLCNWHHTSGPIGKALHKGIAAFEENFGRQDDLILQTHAALGVTIYKDYLESLGVEPLGEVEPLGVNN